MNITKKIINTGIFLFICLLLFTTKIYAVEDSTKISLSDEEILVNNKKISTEETEAIFLTTNTNNGGNSDEAKAANIEIANVINISEAGTYEFSGSLSDGQIAINSNIIEGEVIIVLNNANITCKNAPAIFVYGKTISNAKCEVVIKTVKDTKNLLDGGKIKENVEGWTDQEDIIYYIEKDYDEDNSYYERYKYDGAISSDVSLVFEGEGILNINSSKKEGIESKMNITINNGTYLINTVDDAINACQENKSSIEINGGFILANILEEAEEGDGIDSNGTLYINGGTVYAFAHPGSDNGIDATQDMYINGGTVLSTGSMFEEFKTSNNTTIIQQQFNKINKNTSIAILDENKEAVFAFITDREISTLVYSSDNLSKDKQYTIYYGVEIEGTLDEYNVYQEITDIDITNASKIEENPNMIMGNTMNRPDDLQQQNTFYTKTTIIIAIIIAVILIIIIIILDVKFKATKITIINLILGIILGVCLTYSITGIIMMNKEPIEANNMKNIRQKPEEVQNMRKRRNTPTITIKNSKNKTDYNIFIISFVFITIKNCKNFNI